MKVIKKDRHKDTKQMRIKTAFLPSLAKLAKQHQCSPPAVVNMIVREGLIARGLWKEDTDVVR